MNYFLTGEKQVGKSTIIRKILDDLNCDYGGLCTMVRMDENSGHRVCHLVSFFSESGLCEASQEPTRDNEIFNCKKKCSFNIKMRIINTYEMLNIICSI